MPSRENPMSKRFGRNQKRRARHALEQKEFALSQMRQQFYAAATDNHHLREQLQKSIMVDVECLRSDFRRRTHEIMATASKHDWFEARRVCEEINEEYVRMAKNRDDFIKHVSDRIAVALARQIGAQYEGRAFGFEKRIAG